MGVATQANLVQLRVALTRRTRDGGSPTGIDLPSAGFVDRFRETLISRGSIKAYTLDELVLRLHEVWGRFCLIAWALEHTAPTGPGSMTDLPPVPEMRCDTTLQAKHAEIHALLWRMRFEQRGRANERPRSNSAIDPCRDREGAAIDPYRDRQGAASNQHDERTGAVNDRNRDREGAANDRNRDREGAANRNADEPANAASIVEAKALSEADRRDAERIPAEAFGVPVSDADDDALLRAACEYAGMLAAIRWILDRTTEFNDPELMQVEDRPF